MFVAILLIGPGISGRQLDTIISRFDVDLAGAGVLLEQSQVEIRWPDWVFQRLPGLTGCKKNARLEGYKCLNNKCLNFGRRDFSCFLSPYQLS